MMNATSSSCQFGLATLILVICLRSLLDNLDTEKTRGCGASLRGSRCKTVGALFMLAISFTTVVANVYKCIRRVLLMLCGDIELNPGPISLSASDLSVVLEKLSSVSHKSYEIAIRLGVSSAQYSQLTAQFTRPVKLLGEVIDHWLKNGTDVSWEHIIDVLKSDIVGERELAAKLELEFVKSLRANPNVEPQQLSQLQNNNESEYDQHEENVDCVTTLASHNQQKSDSHEIKSEITSHEHTKFTFPILKMKMSSSGHSPRAVKEVSDRLFIQSYEMMKRFGDLYDSFFVSLQKNVQMTAKDVVSKLRSYGSYTPIYDGEQKPFLRHKLKSLSDDASFCDVSDAVHDYCSFFNFDIFSHLVKFCGTEKDKSALSDYEEAFSKYAEQKVFQCPSELAKVSDSEQEQVLIVKLDKYYEDCEANQLIILRKKICDIIGVTFAKLCRVEPGCLCLTFQIPCHVLENILPLKSQQEEMLLALHVLLFKSGDYMFESEKYLRRSKFKGLPAADISISVATAGTDSEKPIHGYYRDRLYLKCLPKEDQRRIEKETKERYIPVLTIENVVIHTRPLTGEQLAECFYIQNPLYNQLHMEHQTEEQFQIALVGVWLQRDPLASWRRLIKELDFNNHLEVADKIRHYAKEPSDATLTEKNLRMVLRPIKEPLDYFLLVPESVMKNIKQYCDSEEDRVDEILHYWRSTSPKVSWDWLIGWLHYFEYYDKVALILARKFVHHVIDPSLTLKNIESCLKDVRVDGLATYFNIPSSKQDEFLSKLKNTDTRKHSHLAYWLDNHPVPSWIIIVDSLWMAGEYKAHEQVLERFYLKVAVGEGIEKLRDEMLCDCDKLTEGDISGNVQLLKSKITSLADSATYLFNVIRAKTDSEKMLEKPHPMSILTSSPEGAMAREQLSTHAKACGHKRKYSPDHYSTSSSSTKRALIEVLQSEDHFEVCSYLKELTKDQMCTLGGRLGLLYNKLKRMKTYPDDMVAAWLRQEDNVVRLSGEPSWRSLVKALRDVAQEGIARKIEQEHKIL